MFVLGLVLLMWRVQVTGDYVRAGACALDVARPGYW
jgi:hypothetical protein